MAEPRSTRSNILGAFAAGVIVTAFCGILLWHDPHIFWNDDYQISILPVFADVARSWSEGHIPLLSPYSWVCGNLAGEFQYGTFSVFVNAAVVLIWKFPLTFSEQAAALSITHLFVMAMGAFLLARGRYFSFPMSMFVALVATLNGWMICWGATDWFGALGALAWLPWAWWALEKSLRSISVAVAVPGGSSQQTPSGTTAATEAISRTTTATEGSSRIHRKPLTVERRRLMIATLWPAPFVYLVVTGGFPYTVVMLAVLIAWLAIKSLVQTRSLISVFPMLIGVALGIGLAAPAWLAIFDYVHGSARAVQPSSAHWQWIVPLRALPGLILPSWTVHWTDFYTRLIPHTATELACGLVAPIALISACVTGFGIRESRISTWRALAEIRWELALLVAALLVSMFPTAGMFRWSFRWLPFVHLILALCAAQLLQTQQRRGLIALLVAGGVVIAANVFGTGGEHAFPLAWIYLGLAGLWIIAETMGPGVQRWIPTGISFAALLSTYLCIPPNGSVPRFNLARELTNPAPLDVQRLYLSVYLPPEWDYRIESKTGPVGQVVRPGSTSMWAKLRFVNGYSPIRPAGVAREFNCGIHGELDPDIARTMLLDDSGALEEMGIDGIVVAKEILDNPLPSEWQLVFSNDEGRVFHRPGPPLETVRSVSWLDSVPDKRFALATISRISDSRNHVEAEVDVPANGQTALLKFTRPFFPGYVARLGGERLRVDSYRGLFPIVEIPAGSHGRVALIYRPRWLVLGGAVSVACSIIMVAGCVWISVGRR